MTSLMWSKRLPSSDSTSTNSHLVTFQKMLSRLILGQPAVRHTLASWTQVSCVGFHTSTPSNNFGGFLKKKNMNVAKVKKKDGVTEDYKLIYRMSMEHYIETSKYIGFGGSLGATALLPILIMNHRAMAGTTYSSGFGAWSWGPSWQIFGFWSILLSHALSAFYVCYKVPLRIYYSDKNDNFLFVMNSFLPWKRNLLRVVEAGDVENIQKEKDIFYMNNFRHAFMGDKRVFYIAHNYFETMFYYRKLLGSHSENLDSD